MTSKSSRHREDELRLSERAAEWLDVLQNASASERQEFADWLSSSPAHAREMLFMSALSQQLQRVDLRQLDSVRRVVDAEPSPFPVTERTRPPGPSWKWGWAMAAAVLVAVGAGSWFALHQAPTYSTAIGEQRSVPLEDGSMMELNTRSRVKVRFSDVTRDVQLERGEALFAVEKDAKRPFRVLTGDGVIQAVGTQFNVYRQAGGTTVAVVEGRVTVIPTTGGKIREVGAGETVRIEAGRTVKPPARTEIAKAIAWQQHRLVFVSSPLSEVADEFNRYNRTPELLVKDPQVGERLYSGVFDSKDPASLIQFLREDPELVLEASGDTLAIRAAF